MIANVKEIKKKKKKKSGQLKTRFSTTRFVRDTGLKGEV